VKGKAPDCHVTIIGAGPYGLSSAAYLRAAGVEARVFGEPMAFWENQMPAGMCLRSNWGASHIADPQQALTLDEYFPISGVG
jgi:FAD-dependent urate hydroxylase